MNKSLSGLVLILALGLGLGGFWLAPRLQSNSATVAAATGERVERARRILEEYNAGLERDATISAPSAGDGRLPTINDEQVRAVLERNEALANELKALLDTLTKDWPNEPGKRQGGRLDARNAAAGIELRRKLAAEQASLLDRALAELKSGLGVTHGDATGESVVSAKTLEASILYQQAALLQRRAAALRSQAAGPRAELRGLGQDVAGIQKSTNLAGPSQVDAEIEKVRQTEKELTAQIDQLSGQLADLIGKDGASGAIGELNDKIAERKKAAESARDQMDRMEEQGADLARGGGAAQFASTYQHLADTYARAVSEAALLEFGALTNAEIDDSGDFVLGTYRPATGGTIGVQRGLASLQRDRAALEAELQGRRETLDAARASIKELESYRQTLTARAARDATKVAALKTAAWPLIEKLALLEADARALETHAVQKLNASTSASAKAATLAADEVRTAQTHYQALSPEAGPRSPANLAQQGAWIAAQRQAQKAEAEVLLGRIHYQQFADAQRGLDLLAQCGQALGMGEAGVSACLSAADKRAAGRSTADVQKALADAVSSEAYQTRLTESAAAGKAALEVAITGLENAYRQLREHWTLRAEIAAAYHLLSLFGDEDGSLRETARLNYESVIEGRVDNPLVQAYAQRAKQLTAR